MAIQMKRADMGSQVKVTHRKDNSNTHRLARTELLDPEARTIVV